MKLLDTNKVLFIIWEKLNKMFKLECGRKDSASVDGFFVSKHLLVFLYKYDVSIV